MADFEHNIIRIHGEPEEFLQEFIEKRLEEYAGRVYGVCIHLEVRDAEDPEQSFTCVYYKWPSQKQLMGALTITTHQLASHFSEKQRPL